MLSLNRAGKKGVPFRIFVIRLLKYRSAPLAADRLIYSLNLFCECCCFELAKTLFIAPVQCRTAGIKLFTVYPVCAVFHPTKIYLQTIYVKTVFIVFISSKSEGELDLFFWNSVNA